MTVVVGYVPTDTGFFAVTEAEREARARDVAVVIVNVIGYSGYTVPTAADEKDLDAVTAYLSSHGVPNKLRQITRVVDESSVAAALLNVAREEHAQVIVLGLHRKSRFRTRLLGSTVESVVLGAPCPVLVVPDVDTPETRDQSGGL
jgi:nucleotide-binding universal stress UspA family protein